MEKLSLVLIYLLIKCRAVAIEEGWREGDDATHTSPPPPFVVPSANLS